MFVFSRTLLRRPLSTLTTGRRRRRVSLSAYNSDRTLWSRYKGATIQWPQSTRKIPRPDRGELTDYGRDFEPQR